MKRINYHIILFGIMGIFCYSCEKIETDAAKAILGKWEIIEMGNWPDMEPVEEPLAYVEYLPDSILREYEYKTKRSYFKKYWIDDSLLYECIPREDGYQLIIRYKYQFSHKNDILRLDIQAFAINNTSIHKRLK